MRLKKDIRIFMLLSWKLFSVILFIKKVKNIPTFKQLLPAYIWQKY